MTQINSPYLSSGTKAGRGGITVYGEKGQRIIDGVFLMAGPFVSELSLKMKFKTILFIPKCTVSAERFVWSFCVNYVCMLECTYILAVYITRLDD